LGIFLTKCHFPVAADHAGVATGEGPPLTDAPVGKRWFKALRALPSFLDKTLPFPPPTHQLIHLETELNKRHKVLGNNWGFFFQMISPLQLSTYHVSLLTWMNLRSEDTLSCPAPAPMPRFSAPPLCHESGVQPDAPCHPPRGPPGPLGDPQGPPSRTTRAVTLHGDVPAYQPLPVLLREEK